MYNGRKGVNSMADSEQLNNRIIEYDEMLCYPEAIQQGCDEHFLDAFEKRMIQSPLNMTKSFLNIKNPDYVDIDRRLENIMKWNIWMRILIKNRPELENHKERLEALKLLKKYKVGEKRFYKEHRSNKIWWVEDFIPKFGVFEFTFDKKKIYNLFADYPHNLTKEEKEIFDNENPFWANFFKDRIV